MAMIKADMNKTKRVESGEVEEGIFHLKGLLSYCSLPIPQQASFGVRWRFSVQICQKCP